MRGWRLTVGWPGSGLYWTERPPPARRSTPGFGPSWGSYGRSKPAACTKLADTGPKLVGHSGRSSLG